MTIEIKRFRTMQEAKVYQSKFRKDYGYNPNIFEVKKDGKFIGFEIVKPKGLEKI